MVRDLVMGLYIHNDIIIKMIITGETMVHYGIRGRNDSQQEVTR